MTYTFKRTDTGEPVEVDFETMMQQDAAGFVTIQIDGKPVEVRRVRDETKEIKAELPCGNPKIVSDAAGFHYAQLGIFEELRQKHGLTGIEHKPDPHAPGFIQVHASSQKEFDRYLKARGMYNASGKSGSGSMLTPNDYDRARKEAIKKYGLPKKSAMPVDAG